MKVKQLIAKLEKCDPELEVCFSYVDIWSQYPNEDITHNVKGLDIVRLGVNPINHGISNIKHGEPYANIW